MWETQNVEQDFHTQSSMKEKFFEQVIRDSRFESGSEHAEHLVTLNIVRTEFSFHFLMTDNDDPLD